MSRKETIAAIILLILFGTGMHFVHHAPFFNHFLGYIFPVTESVMAHMKMVLYPMLLLSLFLVISRRDNRFIREWWPLWLVAAVILVVLTGILTYNHPDNLIFAGL